MSEYYAAPHVVVERINAWLSLPATGKEQDWEIELGTAELIPKILDLLEAGSLDLEERSALWLLMMGSIEDAVDRQVDIRHHMSRAAPLLKLDPAVRDRMRFHWVEGDHVLYPEYARALVD